VITYPPGILPAQSRNTTLLPGCGRRKTGMTGSRIALPLGLAFACAIAALAIVPRGFDAEALLAAQDDPSELTDRRLDRSFNAAVAAREIKSALAADDADLATSFLDLARDRNVPVDPALVAQVEAANSTSASAARAAGSFARGLFTGEPDDLVGLAGTAVGDLFVFGDIRDAVREGTRLVSGEPADELILGLAGVGLAVTAGTYASLGTATPARIGLSVLKAARKTGRIGARMGEWIGRSLREIVDVAALKRAAGSMSIIQPAIAVRAAREAVKVEKTEGLVRLVSDLGRVQSKAGTKAALDGLKISEGPRDVAKVARLAEVKGGKTRAILKLFGRGAILLTASAFNLFSWMLTAVFMLYSFCAACKKTTERATERHLARRKRRLMRQRERFVAMTAHA
jgi:hypothetical protein